MAQNESSSKEQARRRAMDELMAYDRFADEQGGVYPPRAACAFLKIGSSGLDYAARTGGIKYVTYGNTRYYGRKSVLDYRWTLSRKFHDHRRTNFSPGQAGLHVPRYPNQPQPDENC